MESQDDYRQSNLRRNAAHDRRHATGSLAPLRVPRRSDDRSGRARRCRAGLRHTDGRYLCRLAVSDQRRARAHRHVFGPQCSWFLVDSYYGPLVHRRRRRAVVEAGRGRGVADHCADSLFIVEGIFQAVAAFTYRDAMPRSWGWLLASGLADLALAAIIIAGWPGTAAWTLGLLVGVNLLTTGWAVVMVALGAREIAQSVKASIAGG